MSRGFRAKRDEIQKLVKTRIGRTRRSRSQSDALQWPCACRAGEACHLYQHRLVCAGVLFEIVQHLTWREAMLVECFELHQVFEHIPETLIELDTQCMNAHRSRSSFNSIRISAPLSNSHSCVHQIRASISCAKVFARCTSPIFPSSIPEIRTWPSVICSLTLGVPATSRVQVEMLLIVPAPVLARTAPARHHSQCHATRHPPIVGYRSHQAMARHLPHACCVPYALLHD